MSNRIFIHPDAGGVVSKPAKDATNPALADVDKIFDSSWAASGQIILCKIVTHILPKEPHDLNFDTMYPKDLGYIPHGQVYCVCDIADGFSRGIWTRSPFPLPGPVNNVNGYTIGFGPVARGGGGGADWSVHIMTDRVRLRSVQTATVSVDSWIRLLYLVMSV